MVLADFPSVKNVSLVLISLILDHYKAWEGNDCALGAH